jgi:hypothetical protein
MASANSTFTDLVASTLRNHKSEVYDLISRNNALFAQMRKRGNKESVSGGYEIVRPIDFAENSTYQRYSGFEQLSIAQSEVVSAVKYDWKQASVNVVQSGLELRANNSKEAIFSLAEARRKNAMRTYANNLSIDMYSAGTADSSKQIGGLQALLSTDGTGTVGGVNAGTYSVWANQYQNLSGSSGTLLMSRLQTLWINCTRGADHPTMGVAENTVFSAIWNDMTQFQRYTSDDTEANFGFLALKFNGAPLFHDPTGSGIPSGYIYFLNTNYIGLTVHSEADIEPQEDKVSVNQDGVVLPILFQGNMTLTNRALQGVGFGFTE